jgi:DNA alkylation repair enzyme
MPQKNKDIENPSAFKLWMNDRVVNKIGKAIKAEYAAFDLKEFSKVSKELGPLELKARVLAITAGLKKTLPPEYKKALNILVKSMKTGDLSGFELWPVSEYISQFGLDHFDESLKAMYQLTQRFTAEFAVRPFLNKDHQKVLKTLDGWTEDKSSHVRRWISEGTRPLLPWGAKIHAFIKDPSHTVSFLEKLRHDEELYVRKSVANHLNDISKHHPQVVVETLSKWLKDVPAEHQPKIDWIKRHALRTLIKKGHPGALKLMGVQGKAKVKVGELKLSQKTYKLNDKLSFELAVTSTFAQKQKLVVDYAIDFIKANGKLGQKVYKLKTFEIGAKETVTLAKSHSLKPITTMKYYSGKHHVKIQVNGEKIASGEFIFKV